MRGSAQPGSLLGVSATELKPSEVFTPNEAPLRESNVYAARAEAEEGLRRAVSRKKVPVVYGEYGVGKTTLVRKYFQSEEQSDRLVRILTPADKSFSEVPRIALEALNYSVAVSTEQSSGATVEGSVEAGVFGTLKAKIRGQTDERTQTTSELVVTEPTDHGLIRILSEGQIIIAIDEMHKASDAFRRQLAELIKAVSTYGAGYPQIVVLGTTDDARNLVEQDPGIDRVIQEVRVNPMTDSEAEFVVRDGMEKLGLSISDGLVEKIIRTAAGAPALLQEICLDIAELAVGDNRAEVTDADLEQAVNTFLLSSEKRLTGLYMAAIETTGPHRYRKQILRAMAESGNDFVTMDELTKRVSEYVNTEVPSSRLSGPLRELKQEAHGEILRDVPRPAAAEGRVYNLTAFRDPRMKAFIRVMHAVEEQGNLPHPDDLAGLASK